MDEKGNFEDDNYDDIPLDLVILDLLEVDIQNIMTKIVNRMISEGVIPQEEKNSLIESFTKMQNCSEDNHSDLKLNGKFSGASDKTPNFFSGNEEDNFNRVSSIRKSLTKVFHVRHSNPYHRFNRAHSPIVPDTNERPQCKEISRDDNFLGPSEEFCTSPFESSIKESTAVFIKSLQSMKESTVALVRLKQPIAMELGSDGKSTVRFIIVIVGPFKEDKDYLPLKNSITKIMSNSSFYKAATETKRGGAIKTSMRRIIRGFHASSSRSMSTQSIPKVSITMVDQTEIVKEMQNLNETERDPLTRRGRLFYGLIQDIKVRYPKYWSDIRDGINPQVLSACIFIFFAALSPTITFGGMYSDRTARLIGVGETLLVSSINGIIFALFAAQPLLIIGATGPLMIFDISLLTFSGSMDLDFLSIRVWVGIWILVIGLVVAAFELVSIVRHFTRFTEEIFSSFVCFIFIYGAFEKLAAIFVKHPLQSSFSKLLFADGSQIFNGSLVNGTLIDGIDIEGDKIEDSEVTHNQPNTALLSLCLMIGTFLIAWKLKRIRNSKYFGRNIRRALGDFGVPIAIFLMVLVDYLIRDTYTDKLTMPKGLQPSNAEVRGWFINPFGVIKPLPLWCIFAACPAALLLFILIFLEENICHLILSKPERCLKKGSGFHLDIVLSCLINTISGFLGAPFMGPATVRTIAHMSSLTVMGKSILGNPPKIVDCIEQRISAFTVSLLVGLAVLLYSVLNLVPKAVLYGIFLYMGVSATSGIQMLERTILFFVPVKYHGDAPYVKDVSTKKMHCFTVLQLVILVALWVIKQSPAALAVPFVLLLLIPVRLYVLPYAFTIEELVALDGAPASKHPSESHEEADFYVTAHTLPTQIDDNLLGPRPSFTQMGRRLSQIALNIVDVKK